MLSIKKISFYAFSLAIISLLSCNIYKFNEATVPPEVKTVKVVTLDNRARYVNPQLSPQLSDRLRQKIVGQTRLAQTNADNAHYEISGYISDYTVSTSGISQQKEATNRLTVGVHITLVDRVFQKDKEFDISRSFDFSANLSLQTAEGRLMEDILKNLTDEIFNRIFSDW
jgi:hypothetical protein